MSRARRQAIAILFLASFVAAAPVQAKPFGRTFAGAARIESAARGLFAFFLRLFDPPQVEEKTSSTMDPNGKPSPNGGPSPNGNP
jgi:hypothetical protein